MSSVLLSRARLADDQTTGDDDLRRHAARFAEPFAHHSNRLLRYPIGWVAISRYADVERVADGQVIEADHRDIARYR